MPMERDSNTGGSFGQLSTGAGSLGGGGGGSAGSGMMHHSHSTPAGVDGGGARTPPTTPKKGGKMLAVRVQMLDDTITMFQVQAKALGRVLFEQVCKQLHLLEADYFGLEYQDVTGTKYWLDLQKPVCRQLGLSLVDPLLYFCVKFYTPDPAQLEEEYTRYLFCLQVKRDLAQGLLQCNDNTAALMASYIVQAECGDYVVEDYPDHTYLSSYKFVPHQDQELERRIMENHKKHAGQSPAEADLNLLETARRCELYGMKMHPAKDHEGVALNLAVAHMGLVVFQNFTKINTFSWAKIRKISFKRKRFLIKLHPEGYGYYKDTVEFFFEGRNECKNFWKKCVENHGFFRCSSVKHIPRHKTRVLSRGSSFRYSGKTQKQIVEFVRDNYVKRQTFQRSASFRHSSAHSSAANVHTSLVGNSISAHPLLPLADNNLVNAVPPGSNLSTLLDSMGVVGDRQVQALVSPMMKAAYRPPDTVTSWNMVPSTTHASIINSSIPRTITTTTATNNNNTPVAAVAAVPASRTMSSPSPPLTMRSASAVTSLPRTITPHHLQQQQPQQRITTTSAVGSSPVAVRAAVHRADITGQQNTHHTILQQDTTYNNITRTHNHYQTHIQRTPHTVPVHTHSTTTRTLCNNEHLLQKSEGSLDQVRYNADPLPYAPYAQTQSQIELGTRIMFPIFNNDIECRSSPDTYPMLQYKSETSLPKRHVWQRSASCRDLYDFSFEDSGQAKRRVKSTKSTVEKSSYINLEERKLESPITRYDDTNRALYSTCSSRNISFDIHQDIIVPGQKVYSSSYPGTTSLIVSQESMEDPGNYELAESQDDLSHDSYELLERSDEEFSTSGDYRHRKTKSMATRSCSLDSGNYLPTDSESDSEKHHKYKSSSDLHQDIFIMDDPRDFPREKIPRKSDGSFYKQFKIGSRTSSLESRSDYYDSRMSKTSSRKSPWDHSFGSRTSSQESKSDYDMKKTARKNKSFESLGLKSDYIESRTSSLDSKSDYYDAISKIIDEPNYTKYYQHDYDRNIQFERNYGTQKTTKTTLNYDSFPSFKETSHVHSISLQNVETEQNIRANRLFADIEQQNTVPRTHKASVYSDQKRSQTTHIWPESIAGVPTEIQDWSSKVRSQRSTESESNIFSFDEDKIQSLQESDMELGMCAEHTAYSIVSAMKENNALIENDFKSKPTRNNYRDVFMEIEPKRLEMGRGDVQLPLHQPIERTKSDPNSIANRQRLVSNSRRHILMHQKSIDLTPAESSDEDYLFKQIPSAPPLTKYRGTRFEMPTAEFGHFDVLKRETEGQKTKFEVPKSQFEVLGAKTQSDLVNLPPKSDFDIPYVLHKRHMMNGTASKLDDKTKYKEPEKVVSDVPVITADKIWKPVTDSSDECKSNLPTDIEPPTSFLFTQNIDLSKIDRITLEVDKSEVPIQHMASPKRDITKIDPIMLEALSSKLSQIESDSPTSSKTESLKPEFQLKIQKQTGIEQIIEENKSVTKQITVSNDKTDVNTKQLSLKDKIKYDIKGKRIIKPRMQPNKKGGKNKTKVRITSFSSDDESLDSDDVFGCTEATPTKLEFSPPQMRKEMESILKYESERQSHLQYTMSSTEVEGSPPTTRKTEYLPYDRSLDPNYQTELRRISERSISIPSSEDDINYKNVDLNKPVFEEPEEDKTLTTLTELVIEECPTITEDSKETKLTSETISEDQTRIEVKPLVLSPAVQRKKGQVPLLFAHARLNLSEGSAFAVIQKQTATSSPTAGRRAKSLDTPIISVNKLPPLNAFSSKDDTVEEKAEADKTEVVTTKVEKLTTKMNDDDDDDDKKEIEKEFIEIKETDKFDTDKTKTKKHDEKEKLERKELKNKKSEEKDQIVPDVITKTRKSTTKSGTSHKVVSTQKSLPVDSTSKSKSITSQKALPTTISPSQKLAAGKSTVPSKSETSKKSTSSSTTATVTQKSKEKLPTQKSLPVQKTEKDEKPNLPTQRSLPLQQTLQPPEVQRAKSQEIESNGKRIQTKEKSKSFEKLELKKSVSKERTKSQDDSDTDITKRIEKQQMLYETAIKQTLKSPVKDTLPVFPTVEETVRVNDGKLEISIDTKQTSNISLEDAIIITKSPKKLDKKLTKSLELNLTLDQKDTTMEENDKSVQRLGKSLDLETLKAEAQEQLLEFDFKPESIKSLENVAKSNEEILQVPVISETSPESDEHVVEQVIEAEVHNEPAVDVKEKVLLEGTTLDIWLSVDDSVDNKKTDVMEKITVIQKSEGQTFFEDASTSKPPDLSKEVTKQDTKSSSESQSLEKQSLGNSLDIKYIDDSGDSSHKSDKDSKLIVELQKSIAIDNTLSKKIEKVIRNGDKSQKEKKINVVDNETGLVRITSEDESLTEVSELKFETTDSHLLGFDEQKNKGALMKLSIERSRSEDTASWVTVECDEYLGTDSFDVEETPIDSPEKEVELKNDDEELKTNLLSTETKNNKISLLKRSSDQSRSSDTTGSWTSGEKDCSPGNNLKETGDESSISCSIAKTIGLSQHIERFESLEQLAEKPSHRIPTLERSSPIDEESSSASNGFTKIKDDIKNSKSDNSLETGERGIKTAKGKYPFEQKWASDSELSQRIHKKINKKLSSGDKNSLSSLDDSLSDKRWNGKGSLDKPTLQSIDKLSVESRNSLDTESSSGSLGVATRLQKTGELPVREPSSTWRPFLIESSGSSSLEEGLLPPDQDYFLSRQTVGEYSGHYYDTSTGKTENETTQKDEESYDFQDDLAEFPTNFGYPCLTSAIGGIGIGTTDVLGSYGTAFLARTLSRISERSTNSENTSLEDDSTKASTHSDSVNDESLMSSDHQASLSSDPASNEKRCSNDSLPLKQSDSGSANGKQSAEHISEHINQLLLHRQMSDDRRTSAEMADLSIDDIEIITSERGLKFRRQDSDDTIIDEENLEEPKNIKPSVSQESEDWPLPEIPTQIERIPRDEIKPLEILHDMPSADSAEQHAKLLQITPPHIPKIFGQRASLKSQDSEQWPSPPSSLLETPVVGNVESYYMTPEEACKVTVDSCTDPTCETESNPDSSEDNKTLENDNEMNDDDDGDADEEEEKGKDAEENSDSVSGIPSAVKIVLEVKSPGSHSSSEEDMNITTLNDDVFTDVLVDTSKNELRPPTVLRRSTTSDDSSHSGTKNELKPPSSKHSHSSYSEEECTSSVGTNFEEGTVRFALRPAKCTHSSHSEDTSIALSLSEWSNSTNTVKFQSNNSCTNKSSTNTSGALKSDDNSLTDIAHSISEWSSSNSHTLLAQQSGAIQFQKLATNASSTGDSSTLTDMVPTVTNWSSSETALNTIVPQISNNCNTINIEGCLEQFLDDSSSLTHSLPLPLKSPDNIPSEDLIKCHLLRKQTSDESKYYTKSTERPVTIPFQHVQSDTEKSTESSSQPLDDFEKRVASSSKYAGSFSKSIDRSVKVPLKFSKCSPYYSSSLSSESTSAAMASKPIPIIKTATVPLTRTHRKSLPKSFLQSPPSENDSTSSVESPIGTPEARVRGHRRRRQIRHRQCRDESPPLPPPNYAEPEKYMCGKDFSDLPSDCEYKSDIIRRIYSENVEEGYFPDGDSQSGSDIFRIENDTDFESVSIPDGSANETFDVSSIPPPLLEDDFEEHIDRDNNQSSIIANTTLLSENNNSFFSSTPNAKNMNGNNELILNNSYNVNKTKIGEDDISPVKEMSREDIMNSMNANTISNSMATINGTLITAEMENEIKKKPRWATDKVYYVAKEMLMTELTYKKDLDVINVWFREEVAVEKPIECNLLLSLISPLANAHGQLVHDLEQRLQTWEGRGGSKNETQRVGDVLLTHLPPLLPLYEEYIDGHILVLEKLDAAFKSDSRFEQLYRDFESQKACYLPLTTFVLKPLHRLLHYKHLLDRLLKHYEASHPDYADCLTANATLAELISPISETLSHSENLATLCELQRDIISFDSLVQPTRKFIRHGCLLKHSRKGYQQRMFFLFSDILLYTSRSQAALQFKVHGHMPLRGVMLEEPDGDIASYAFIIYGGNRALTVAANSQEEKDRWVEDLTTAIQLARDKTDAKLTYLSLKSCSSSDEIMDQCGTDMATQTKPTSQRSNTTVHVCWHRNTSISMHDQLVAAENQLSGYLLRKFKSSNGWQKLWVVFTSFCLFFYKSCMDEFPLASLPLLGYTVSTPSPEDAIVKDYVFKLQYKNHVYFFRAESEYTFNRWLEVIGSATQSSLRKCVPIRKQTMLSNESSPEK